MTKSHVFFTRCWKHGSALRLVTLFSALLLVLILARKDQAMVLTGEFRMHDPSQIVKCEGKYFVFCTGDNLPMRYSTDLINWTAGPPVLSKVPEWARQAVPAATRDLVWAPDLIFLNNKYYLYYSYSTFGSRISAIGLVTSPTLEPANPNYKWTDEGLVIASNNSNNYNAIDPALTLDTQGELWMSFGSWNSGGIQLVKLDKTSGKPVSQPITLAAGQARGPEAPYIYYRGGYYYLFENEDFCCRGMNSTYRIMMGRSKTITGPYLDKQGKDLARNGGTLFLGTEAERIGPGHMGILREGGIDRFSFHYYDGLSNGRPTMGIRPLLWGADGWPQAGSDLPAGHYAIISKATGLALSVRNGATANGNQADGAIIEQAAWKNDAMQKWNISLTDDGYYSISSLGSGKYVDVFECGTKDGTKIDQFPWFNNACQRWRIEQTSSGAYRIVSKGGGGALTVPGGTKAPQTAVQQFAWKGDSSQQWVIRKLP